jgi:uncharacterized membrane protein
MTLHEYIPHPHAHDPRNINHVHKEKQQAAGFNTRLAVLITKGFGSVWAFYTLIGWMLGWMLLSTRHVGPFGADPYPFVFLLFLSNLVQLWALPVLAVGQTVLGQHGELLAEEQYNTTIKAEHNIEQMMKHLNKQDEKIIALETELLKQTQMLALILKGTENSRSRIVKKGHAEAKKEEQAHVV